MVRVSDRPQAVAGAGILISVGIGVATVAGQADNWAWSLLLAACVVALQIRNLRRVPDDGWAPAIVVLLDAVVLGAVLALVDGTPPGTSLGLAVVFPGLFWPATRRRERSDEPAGRR